MSFTENYDVVVVGAGHAGCEAAVAAARMGLRTALYTMNLDLIAQMSCNPAVGGIAKGHLVREVDALGGVMGEVIDAVGIQFRLLNTSRGPAVWSPRAQADKKQYRVKMRQVLESEVNLRIKQAEVVDLVLESCGAAVSVVEAGSARPAGCGPQDAGKSDFRTPVESIGLQKPEMPALRVRGIRLRDGRSVEAGAVVVTTGTFLNGLIHCGEQTYPAGRSGESPAVLLGEALRSLGLEIGRLKTGTPPRLDARTIDFSQFQVQPGDPVLLLSATAPRLSPSHRPSAGLPTPTARRTAWFARIYIARRFTQARSRALVPVTVHLSKTRSSSSRTKPSTNCFFEPEGMDTYEIYLNGMSTSMPIDVQWAMVRSIPGLENADMIRPGYAIEYDMVQPTELNAWLETKKIQQLFLAGQINGTTGYEEAACQGIMAGINAGLRVQGKAPVIIGRSQGYTGILIDDLISKGAHEPYRMFTSRAEFRLHLRIDNADERLMPIGYQVGTIKQKDYHRFLEKRARISAATKFLLVNRLDPNSRLGREIYARLGLMVGERFAGSCTLTGAQLLKRPEVSFDDLSEWVREGLGAAAAATGSSPAETGAALSADAMPAVLLPCDGSELSREEVRRIETDFKYEGYLAQQEKQMERMKRAESHRIPEWFDYGKVSGLSREVVEKFTKVRPLTLGQALRIPGVTPAAVSLVNVYIEIFQRRAAEESPSISPN